MAEREATTPRRPTLRMVAERAGVSTATVSYVFSGRAGAARGQASPRPPPPRVLAAADELNYRPNSAARAIRTGRSGMVQLSLHMLSDPWSLAVADAVNVEANRHGLTTLILADGDWHAALDRVESDVAYLDGVGLDEAATQKLADLVQPRPAAGRVLGAPRAAGIRRRALRRDPRMRDRDGPPARAAHGDRMPRRGGRRAPRVDAGHAVHAVHREDGCGGHRGRPALDR